MGEVVAKNYQWSCVLVTFGCCDKMLDKKITEEVSCFVLFCFDSQFQSIMAGKVWWLGSGSHDRKEAEGKEC